MPFPGCAVASRYRRAGTMLGSRVSLQDVARKREGSKWRYKPRTRGPARPAAPKDYNAILPVMGSRWESSGSDGSGKSWACGVSRSRSSRRQQTHAIRCPLPRTSLTNTSKQRRPVKSGSLISPISPRKKDGSIAQPIKISSTARLSAMHWDRGSPRTS